VNRRTRQGYLAGHELHLTRTEFEVLNILARAGDSLVTNHTFQKLVWQTDELLYRESLRKYIQRLRHKLETQPDADLTIVAVHGMGYRLAHLHDSPASRHCAKSS
jgi:two-component system KDP operon response regulator KdpE